ncbi:4Fe-4S binding protein [Oceanidesulfovibrio marinus]|uniref:4Fe-4S binding protein n=2 Tax=Oceanidesulfovibrio marinus TaxID=370038 RepID=A0ABX6NGV8_9BACT|nr:4Fe-4S binding protein [Oceanidesulfovibrio marinus]
MSPWRHPEAHNGCTRAAMLSKLTPALLQRVVQIVFALVCIFIGWRFYQFCVWAQTGAGDAVSRPAGVEGFLPISALLGLKHFILTGSYDPAHPAGLTILLFALCTGVLLRRGFCAYICPVGLISNLLAAAGRRLGLERRVPRMLDIAVKTLKYPLLAFFLFTVVVVMSGAALQAFLMGRYNLTADAHLLRFFMSPSHTALVVLGSLVAISLLFRNAWCRWLCPYGALLGLLSWVGITNIRRTADACTGCQSCQRVCPANIPIHEKTTIRTPECIGCARCVGSCSRQHALHVTVLGRPVHWAFLAVATVGLFLAFWLVAQLTGHWHSSLPPMMLKSLYAQALGGM